MRATGAVRAAACGLLALALIPGLSAADTPAATPATPPAVPTPPAVRIGPSADGHLGAWLLLGPYRSASHGVRHHAPSALATPPPDVDEAALTPSLGAAGPTQRGDDTPHWILAASGEGAIDVRHALEHGGVLPDGAPPPPRRSRRSTSPRDKDLVAYAAGTLHLARAAKVYLLLGSDDGVRVTVDGKVVLTREEARPQRDDDDTIPLDLAAGDHPVRLKLHQRDGAWSFRLRILETTSLDPPPGEYLSLPGAGPDLARALAAEMSWVSVDRGMTDTGYAPRLRVRFPEGLPLGVPLRVRARLESGKSTLFDVDAGEVPRAASELVVALPRLSGKDLLEVEHHASDFKVQVAGRDVEAHLYTRSFFRVAVQRADEALRELRKAPPAWLGQDTLESVQNTRDRIVHFVDRGDPDLGATLLEARELLSDASMLKKGHDPFVDRTGPLRMAYRSPTDGGLSEYALYVPPSYKPGTSRRYPLVVTLHGLNGKGMAMLRWFFGGDVAGKPSAWEDRHVESLPELDAFVVSPTAYGNSMYRDLGEDDVVRVMDRVMARYPIDPDRVTMTGASMGGIGAAAIPFRYPDRFAAAEPLCGYHSYFVRRDFIGRPIRPWEHVVAAERSNSEWAYNGWGIPLYVVQGKKDWPQTNSGVLIDEYHKLHYSIIDEHPDLGHNVWRTTYADFKGAKWLLQHVRDPHPARVRFRTIRPRNGTSYWVHVTELARPDAWGQVDARVLGRHALRATTTGVAELRLDEDAKLVDPGEPLTVTADGQKLTFPAGGPVVMHREGTKWKPGPALHQGPYKRGEITGPIRDAFHQPLLFVYGASDPAQARANEEVARRFAAIRHGMTVDYPVVSDTEFASRGYTLDGDHALFLVGNARSNSLVRALEPELPIKVEGDAVVVGTRRFTGDQLGTAFVRPNPRRPDRYLVVVEGTGALGTWRSLSLPNLLPDFVVYDQRVAPARGQMLLSAGQVQAAGFFRNDWSLPATMDDPMAKKPRPAAKSEYDATPYLP